MWPLKQKSEFTNMSSVHALILILLALTFLTSLLTLVKVKMLYKESAKTRDALTQIQADMSQFGGKLGAPDRRMMLPPRP